jgi:hypothetical protein
MSSLFSIDKDTVEGFASVMKKCINMLSSNKIIGIQEAQYGIMQMPLTLSSDLPYYVTTTTKMKLSVDNQGTALFDIKTCYAKRDQTYKSMSLAEFFYQVHKNDSSLQTLFEMITSKIPTFCCLIVIQS